MENWMDVDRNAKKETALRFMRASQCGEVNVALDCITDDYELVFPRPGLAGAQSGLKGRDSFSQLMAHKLPYQSGSLVSTIESVVAEGNMVVIQFRLNAITLNGEEYENFYVKIHKFRGSLIAKSWEYLDTAYGVRMLLPDEAN